MSFLAPQALWALAALPLVVGLYVLLQMRRAARRPAALIPATSSRGASKSGGAGHPRRRRHIPAVLFLLALVALLVSFGRPEANVTLPTSTGRVVLAFDTSNSMFADDVEPTRLDAAKQVALDFVDRRPGSVQIGVVAFTNGGLVVQAPTKDDGAVRAAIERLTPDGGTSIGEGIFASLTAIADEPIEISSDDQGTSADINALDIGYYSNAAIVVFTDGEDIGGADPIELAGLAANSGVAVYTVGVGTPRGTIVALDGFSIATALDEDLLTAIAESTGGAHFLAAEDPELKGIFDAIDRRFERQGERIEVTALFGLLAMVLIAVAGMLSVRWNGRV